MPEGEPGLTSLASPPELENTVLQPAGFSGMLIDLDDTLYQEAEVPRLVLAAIKGAPPPPPHTPPPPPPPSNSSSEFSADSLPELCDVMCWSSLFATV